MSAHTPGPWHAHHDHGWLVVESDNGDLYIKIEKGSTATRRIADARLIATAPRMLDSLKRAAHILAEIDQATAPAVLALRTEIVATIKKADPSHYGSEP